MTEQPKDFWDEICKRAGIEREPDDKGPPTHVGMTLLFAWHPTKDEPNTISTTCQLPHATKPTVFQVGQQVPLKPSFHVLAVFDDGVSPTVRVYAMHGCVFDSKINRPEKPEDLIPLRWTLTRTTTTMSVQHYPDPDTFLDTIAAELIAAEEELSEVLDPEEEAPPASPDAPQLG